MPGHDAVLTADAGGRALASITVGAPVPVTLQPVDGAVGTAAAGTAAAPPAPPVAAAASLPAPDEPVKEAPS